MIDRFFKGKIFVAAFIVLQYLLLFQDVFAQGKQVEIVNSDLFEGDESLGKGTSRLKGNVCFKHKGALMYCDSAYLYQITNSLDAFGTIRIIQGDSIRLTGKLLKYNGNSGVAVVSGDVLLSDRDMNLRSESLNYDLNSGTASYLNGGTLTDPKNKLQSRKGFFYSNSRKATFRDSVSLSNPDYLIKADSLSYLTSQSRALFIGPTNIYSTGNDSTRIYCENGFYDSVREFSVFKAPNRIWSGSKSLRGDSLSFDNKSREGKAFGNVVVNDTSLSVVITGEYGYSNEKNQYALVTGKAMLVRSFKADSLFLHADTLMAWQDPYSGYGRWTAYHGVRFFKSDLQGVCDSMTYHTPDSLLTLYSNPVIWHESTQLTADKIVAAVNSTGIHRTEMISASFVVTMEDSLRFSQIKGKNMDGWFFDNHLNRIDVFGNSQSVYYTRNKKKEFTGVNRAESSDMLILFDDDEISKLTMINDPLAVLYPVNELQPSELKLKGFVWMPEIRPIDRLDIFRK